MIPEAIQLPTDDPCTFACMAVAFEYITGESRHKVIGHHKYRIEKGGLDWRLFVDIAGELGFKTRVLYTAEVADVFDNDGFGELVDKDTLVSEISKYPSIVAERNHHNMMGDKFTTEHALAYVGSLQLDSVFGQHYPNSRRNIVGAVVFTTLTIESTLARIRESSRQWQEQNR